MLVMRTPIRYAEPMRAIHLSYPRHRSRLELLACLLLVLFAAAVSCLKAAPAGPPNVVVVLIDDMGWGDLSCMGSQFYKTPNIDRMAAEGMKFTQGYASCPVCSPTRASLLTGKYPARLNLTDWLTGRRDMPSQKLRRPQIEQGLPLSERTLAELLKPKGYVSASIGKWHLGGGEFLPQHQGFDLNIAGNHAGSPASFFYPYTNRNSRIPDLEQGEPGEYLTDRLTSEAVKFIREHKDRPFFVYLAHYAVHIPLQAKRELVEKYKALGPQTGPHTNVIYAAMIDSVDQSVGRILDTLDDLKLSDNTLVIFTSDNGGLSVPEGPFTPATSNAPLRAGKGYLYEGGIRVPLIVRWPAMVSPGSQSAVPANSLDLFATIIDATKTDAPSESGRTSLLPWLTRSTTGSRSPLFWHYPHYSNQGGRPGGAIRDGNLKLIEFYEDGRRELYDLSTDPAEELNLANQTPSKTLELASKLEAWRQAVGARMPAPNPDYDPAKDRLPAYVIRPASDREIELHARDVNIHGSTVRYEPQPHKNTIGYWTRAEDWVSWDFVVAKSGKYDVEILQGCGPGNGGSNVELTVAGQSLNFVVAETKGFQDFIKRNIGTIEFEQAGRYTLAVKPKNKSANAIMDLRSVVLQKK